MKLTKVLFVLTAFLVLSCKTSSNAVKNTVAKSLLWKIEGNDIKTSYLYGTIHIIPKEDFKITDKTQKAFDATEQLVLELDMDDPSLQMEILKHTMFSGKEKITDYMNEEESKKIDAALQESSGYNLTLFQKMKPFVINTLLLTSFIDGETTSYEETFMSMAKDSQKEILGLETVEEQITIFDQSPYEDQVDDIISMIDEKEKNKGIFKEMIAIYQSEDVEKLYNFTEEQSKESKALDNQSLLENRNRNWIPNIEKLAKEKTSFFAVGAAHLGGEAGVISLLKKAGFVVTPIIQ